MPNKQEVVKALQQFSGGSRTIDPRQLKQLLVTDFGDKLALSESQASLAVARIANTFIANAEGEVLIDQIASFWATQIGAKKKPPTPYDDWQQKSSYRAPPPPARPKKPPASQPKPKKVVVVPPPAVAPPTPPDTTPDAPDQPYQPDASAGASLDLKLAILTGDAAAVERVLATGANPNAREDTGEFPLLWAANLADATAAKRVVEALLRSGADPRQASAASNESVAYIFASKGKDTLLGPLHAAGADLNLAEEVMGETPLYAACRHGHLRTVEVLLQLGADTNKRTESQETPLWIASCRGHAEAARVLLGAGALIDARDEDGETPLMKAAEFGYDCLVELLLARGADKTLKSDAGMTALDKAVRGQRQSTVGEGMGVGGEGEACVALLSGKPRPKPSGPAADSTTQLV